MWHPAWCQRLLIQVFQFWSNLYSDPCNLPIYFCHTFVLSWGLLPMVDPETYRWVWEKTYGTQGTIGCREESVFFVKVIRWFCTAHNKMAAGKKSVWSNFAKMKLTDEKCYWKFHLRLFLASTQCVGNVHNVIAPCNWLQLLRRPCQHSFCLFVCLFFWQS